jgi:hypothetical protein
MAGAAPKHLDLHFQGDQRLEQAIVQLVARAERVR